MNTETKIAALAKMLGATPGEVKRVRHTVDIFAVGRDEYLVLTDAEATARAREYILESLWAFRPEFIATHAEPRLGDGAIKALSKAQEELCEDANDLVRALIRDVEAFVREVIQADGRGHFLATYNGDELETKGPGGAWIFAYRVN